MIVPLFNCVLLVLYPLWTKNTCVPCRREDRVFCVCKVPFFQFGGIHHTVRIGSCSFGGRACKAFLFLFALMRDK